jgi:hypothetical protein
MQFDSSVTELTCIIRFWWFWQRVAIDSNRCRDILSVETNQNLEGWTRFELQAANMGFSHALP